MSQTTTPVYEPRPDQRTAERLQKTLLKVIELDNADMGNIQVYHEATDKLYMITTQGFSPAFHEAFWEIRPFGAPSCGRAIGLGIPIIIQDVTEDSSLKPVLSLLEFRSVRSIPLFGTDNTKLGVISTHSRQPNHPWRFDHSHPLLKEIAALLYEVKHPGVTTAPL